MTLILVFAGILLAAVLLLALAERIVLSPAVFFLLVGFFVGGKLGEPSRPEARRFG